MDKTTIDCPSCNRRIRIALTTPLVPLEIEPDDFPGAMVGKDYDLRDLLGIYHDLLHEVKTLRSESKLAQENLQLRKMLKHILKNEISL
jgi:hypothetical protein